jgi:GMP synthase (glutamine-hydrolysing)
MSGGVDSTVTAKLMSFLGDRLHLITIDGGQLRENELAEIERHAHAAGARLSVVNAKDRFLSAIGDATDAKTKRERFSGTYGRVFAEQALALGAKYFAQGTLAPDMIESGETGGAQIKKHHNVGLVLPGIKQFHPLARFFKNEVRALAQELRLPGLLATAKNLETVAWGQARTREILERHGLYREISLAGQLVVAYGGPPTVGVKGDARAYHPVFMVRPVRSADFMTSRPFHLPDEVEDEISAVLSAHASATRCFFDYTTKPPATTEFE